MRWYFYHCNKTFNHSKKPKQFFLFFQSIVYVIVVLSTVSYILYDSFCPILLETYESYFFFLGKFPIETQYNADNVMKVNNENISDGNCYNAY